LNLFVLAAVSAALWLVFHFGAGAIAHSLPQRFFASLPLVSRSYDWEDDGRLYLRLGIRWWKDRLPEAGDFYPGGFSKRHLVGHDRAYLGRFVLETARAEFSHWLTWALALTFFAWTPWPVGVLMLLYGAATNLPCILIQRYNRPRLARALAASARGTHRDRTPLPAHTVLHQGEKQ
jgi:glycosyl-4,4'-diaponeurosporenoate acyltransferase